MQQYHQQHFFPLHMSLTKHHHPPFYMHSVWQTETHQVIVCVCVFAGRFAHLPLEQLARLEEEVKAAAADSEKAKDLEEFLDVVKEEFVGKESEEAEEKCVGSVSNTEVRRNCREEGKGARRGVWKDKGSGIGENGVF